MTQADVSTQIEPQWRQGWGFQWTGPDDNINNATQTRVGGTTNNVIRNPNGSNSYVPMDPATQSPTPPGGSSVADSSARAIIDGALGQYGLSSLSNWAWSKWQGGESIDQIMLELRGTPEYKTRFPAMEALSQRGHAISEAQYINYEQSASAVFKAAGLPSGFYDSPDDFAGFLTNDVALPELQDRVQKYQTLLYQEPPEVLDAWQNLYGMSQGDALAYYIDPTKALPLIQQKNAAAQAAGWSNVTGFGGLGVGQAEAIGKLGLTEDALRQQFGDLANLNGLYQGLQGTGEGDIGSQTAINAGFFGDSQAKAEIEKRKQERLATFSGGGSVATTQQGASGAGVAR
jgi:hypothetical protein